MLGTNMRQTPIIAAFLRQNQADLTHQQLKTNDHLFLQGDSAEHMYLLLSGKLSVQIRSDKHAKPIIIDQLDPDALVGEMGVLSGRPRNATVIALEPCELLTISAEKYAQLASENRELFSDLPILSLPRWQRLQLATILTNIFGELDVDLLKSIQNNLNWIHLDRDEVLVKQGDSAESMYIIINGRVQFSFSAEDGSHEAVGWAGRGETVGEFALLSDITRSATVTAVRQTDVVEITRNHFDAMAATHPQFIRSVARIIVNRRQRSLYGASVMPEAGAHAITLLPIGDGSDLPRFAEQLANALSVYGNATIIDATRFDEMFGLEGAAQSTQYHPNHTAVVAWINEQESRFDYLIFLPDPAWSVWTKRCLGQSDRLLLVGRSEADAQTSRLELQIKEAYPKLRTDLALWHSAETEQPSNTASWLDQRDIDKYFHVRDGDGLTFGRLARRLTGRAIALCLSGGGARGYAHLGVLRAMQELDIPLDTLGGTSFGALIACKFANQLSYDAMVTLVKKYARNDILFDRTLPLVALNKSAKLDHFCQDYCGDLQIEDLWIPFFAVATNLSQATAQINQRGSLAAAIRKSISIPGVFAPVIEDDNMMVDGGVMNNFPVDLTIEQAESERVIGVHCAPRTSKKYSYDMRSNISGWKVLAHRINPFEKKLRVPPIATTIMRTFDVNSLQLARENENLCDLLIQPEPTKYGLLDFESYQEIIQIGYDRSIEQLRAWHEEQADL